MVLVRWPLASAGWARLIGLTHCLILHASEPAAILRKMPISSRCAAYSQVAVFR
jgi:hypothetical protein